MTEADRWNALVNAAEGVCCRWAVARCVTTPETIEGFRGAMDDLNAALEAWPEDDAPRFPEAGR